MPAVDEHGIPRPEVASPGAVGDFRMRLSSRETVQEAELRVRSNGKAIRQQASLELAYLLRRGKEWKQACEEIYVRRFGKEEYPPGEETVVGGYITPHIPFRDKKKELRAIDDDKEWLAAALRVRVPKKEKPLAVMNMLYELRKNANLRESFFKQFIGNPIRLKPLRVAEDGEVPSLEDFLKGKVG